MAIKKHLVMRSEVLKDQVNRYAILGLVISILSILIATILVSYKMTGYIHIHGMILAQKSNPALWALDLTPFLYAYWGQSFCYELVSTVETLIEDKTRELVNKSSDLELKLQYETNHDYLTGLSNQRLLSQRINQGIKQIGNGEELAVILLHINAFKEINYKHGRFNANSLLVQFAEKLKSILLEPFLLQAYMGMNMVARLQGAEFAVLIPRLRKEHQLETILSSLLSATATNFMLGGDSVNVTTTLGVALYPSHGDTDAALIYLASTSLFYAEKEGLSYAIYHASMGKKTKEKDGKLKELNHAIDSDEIDIWYQPYLELKTDKIIGAESMVHFRNTEDCAMNIEQLLPVIEGTTLIRKLTARMLEHAVEQLAIWHQAGHNVFITVNLFDAADLDLPEFVENLLKEHTFLPEFLKLALTEKACLSDQARSSVVLKKLSDLGTKIIISDFCSGYSSFIYLTNFPISEIRIDESFVQNMMVDEKKLNIVAAAFKLAGALNLTVLAGGVADLKTVKKIKQLGCLYAQGPYFSPAVSVEKITGMLDK
jgi:diguanylate cyclase (GGDEF)-like protein